MLISGTPLPAILHEQCIKLFAQCRRHFYRHTGFSGTVGLYRPDYKQYFLTQQCTSLNTNGACIAAAYGIQGYAHIFRDCITHCNNHNKYPMVVRRFLRTTHCLLLIRSVLSLTLFNLQMGSFIQSSFLLALVASVQAAPARRTTEDHLVRDLRTLAKFAQTVTVDPNGTTSTWTGTDVCAFTGVYCEDSPAGNNAVASIDINGANLGVGLALNGTLDKLMDLALFHANTNGFVGTIPGTC